MVRLIIIVHKLESTLCEICNAMIYVVEDDDAVRDSFRLVLETCGYSVCDFQDSYSLFAYGVRHDVSCFILDANLPNESGFQILSRLRRNQIHSPVIMVSGKSSDEMKAEAEHLEVFAFFDKPLMMDEFIETMGRIKAKSNYDKALLNT